MANEGVVVSIYSPDHMHGFLEYFKHNCVRKFDSALHWNRTRFAIDHGISFESLFEKASLSNLKNAAFAVALNLNAKKLGNFKKTR